MNIPCFAADGKTKVYGAGHVGAMPLMVRATDFNALHAECARLRSAVMSGEGEWVGHKELAALRKDAERYRKLREAGSALKLYVYEDQADPCSGDWQYKPSPEDVDAFADGLGAA